VVGRFFWQEAVEAMVGDQVGAKLNRLEGIGLILERTEPAFSGTREFEFFHAMLREVAYDAVLRRRRAAYHARAADWLMEVTERIGRADEWAAVIARHRDEAAQAGEAARWYLTAARSAAAGFANVEALRLLGRATELAASSELELRWDIAEATERLHDITGERTAQASNIGVMDELASASGEPWRHAEAKLREANHAERVGEYDRGLRATGEALDQAREAGDIERIVRALRTEGGIRWRHGDLAGSQEVLDRAINTALDAGLDDWHARLHRNLGMVLEHAGDYIGAENAYRVALEGARERGERREIALGLNDIGIAAYYQGDLERSRRSEEEALQMRIEMGDLPGEAVVLNNLALTAAALGDAAAARKMFLRTLEVSQQIGDREGVASSHQGLGVMALRLGDAVRARSHMDVALAVYDELGDVQGRAQCLEELGWQALAAGEPEEAAKVARRGIALADEGDFLPEAANGRRLLGRALAEAGRHQEAAEMLRRAVSEQEAVGNEPFAASALAWLAGELVATGAVEAAAESADAALTRLIATQGWGSDDPVGALVACGEVLAATGSARTEEVLEEAHRIAEERAAMIPDPIERHRFTTGVSSHWALKRFDHEVHRPGAH
jgi:tetratricopeptide (TPR) repeat protein